jgi:hypothetical protein
MDPGVQARKKMEPLPVLRIRIEATEDRKFGPQLTAVRLARFLSDKGHEVTVQLVQPDGADPQLVKERRRQMRAVG